MYDIKPQIGYEIADHMKNMSEAGKIYNDTVREKTPVNIDQLVDSYEESLRKQYRESRRVFDVFSRAKKAGLSDEAIHDLLTQGGLFQSGIDKKMAMGMFDKGFFEPARPVRTDILKWMNATRKKGFTPPPVEEATDRLYEVYNKYFGAKTGAR